MKKFIFAFAAFLSVSCLIASAPCEPIDVGKDHASVSMLSVQPSVMHADFIVASDLNVESYSLSSEMGTAAQAFFIDRKVRSWFVPWCIGKSDTKRHCAWKAFVRKLC